MLPMLGAILYELGPECLVLGILLWLCGPGKSLTAAHFRETRTTLMVRDQKIDPSEMHRFMDSYYGSYDFLKVPFDTRSGCYRPFAFVNFVTPEAALAFRRTSGFNTRWADMQGQAACMATLSSGMANLPPAEQPVVMKGGKRADLRVLLGLPQ